MSSWQRPESRFGPCTIIGMYCLADMRRSRTITCWTICAIKCARREQIRIATDGDADRFGIVDGDGTFLRPNYVIAKLFDYLIERRGWKNGMAKSVATTDLINAIAKGRGVKLYEAPVVFKYIGELIMPDKIAIGGEESAGLSIRHYVGEKDGVLAGASVLRDGGEEGEAAGRAIKGAM